MTFIDAIALTGEKWNMLEESEKIEVLQSIENHMAFESNRIACPVEGKFLYTGTDGIVLGMYDSRARCILINSSQLNQDAMYGKNADSLINACIHEGRHAFQHQVVDGMTSYNNKDEVEAWKNNLKNGNYISFRENPRAYYSQPVEKDAREFAELRTLKLVAEREQLELDNQLDYEQAKNAFYSHVEPQNILSDNASKIEINTELQNKEGEGMRF